jgi:glucokinase
MARASTVTRSRRSSASSGDEMASIGVDVGGTNIRAGFVDDTGTIVDQHRTGTPDDGRERMKAIVDLVTELATRTGATGVPVGVGAAGLVDLAGRVRYAPNLDWRDAPLRDDLTAALGVDVRVENDAAAAAWGEYKVGAAQHAVGGALMLTLGTGVGGGLIMDDRLVRGATGIGGEFGHMIIAEGGPRCPCGNRGCLEAMASGTAIGRMVRHRRRDRRGGHAGRPRWRQAGGARPGPGRRLAGRRHRLAGQQPGP